MQQQHLLLHSLEFDICYHLQRVQNQEARRWWRQPFVQARVAVNICFIQTIVDWQRKQYKGSSLTCSSGPYWFSTHFPCMYNRVAKRSQLAPWADLLPPYVSHTVTMCVTHGVYQWWVWVWCPSCLYCGALSLQLLATCTICMVLHCITSEWSSLLRLSDWAGRDVPTSDSQNCPVARPYILIDVNALVQ